MRRLLSRTFFQFLKRERIKPKIYSTLEYARSDVFDYIEMLYNLDAAMVSTISYHP